MTDDPGQTFSTMWTDVVAELNGDLADEPAAHNGDAAPRHLTPQQRAWLNLVKPLTIVEGFALLSVPSSFVQNEIERHLRTQITDALSRRLGQRVELGVRIAPTEPDTEPEPTPAPATTDLVDTEPEDEVDEDGEALASAHESWPGYFTDRRGENTSNGAGTSLNRR